MKMFLLIFLILFNSTLLAKVNKRILMEFYNGCLDDAKNKEKYEVGLKVCKCAINLIDKQLDNEEFEKIFNSNDQLSNKWMRENLLPNCNYEKN